MLIEQNLTFTFINETTYLQKLNDSQAEQLANKLGAV